MSPHSFAPNRFDLIRQLLAAGVFAYHAVALTGMDTGGAIELAFARLAEVSIQGFFIVSGALVASSLDRSSSLGDYAGKRFRRLYPAYAVIILIPALVSFAMTQEWQGVLRYLTANLVFLNFIEPNLPGLFGSNLYPEVNGALWTLKIEVMFYIILPLILLVLKILRAHWWLAIAALYVAGTVWAMQLPLIDDAHLGNALSRQLPGQMAFFAMGIALWKCADRLLRRWAPLGLAGAVLTAASLSHPLLEPLRASAWRACLPALPLPPAQSSTPPASATFPMVSTSPISRSCRPCSLLACSRRSARPPSSRLQHYSSSPPASPCGTLWRSPPCARPATTARWRQDTIPERNPMRDADYDLIKLDVTRAGVAVVTLNRPEVHNAFNAELIAELTDVFAMIADQPGIRMMILRGEGKSFSAGADLEWMKLAALKSREDNETDAENLAEMLQRLYEMPQMTLALVQGAAMGAGRGWSRPVMSPLLWRVRSSVSPKSAWASRRPRSAPTSSKRSAPAGPGRCLSRQNPSMLPMPKRSGLCSMLFSPRTKWLRWKNTLRACLRGCAGCGGRIQEARARCCRPPDR